MSALRGQSWFITATVIGLLYSVIGIVLGLPANNVRMWRLAAWVVSAVVFAAHIGYEHFQLCNTPVKTALHAAWAVAVGAFGLAVAANIHEVWVGPSYRRLLAVALVAWPVLIGLPAFVVALMMAWALALVRRTI